jgi:hypothetical protein
MSRKEAEIQRLDAEHAGDQQRLLDMKAVLQDCLTAMEERWGAVGSPPHLLDQIRAVLGSPPPRLRGGQASEGKHHDHATP